jgi:hypothetical protein
MAANPILVAQRSLLVSDANGRCLVCTTYHIPACATSVEREPIIPNGSKQGPDISKSAVAKLHWIRERVLLYYFMTFDSAGEYQRLHIHFLSRLRAPLAQEVAFEAICARPNPRARHETANVPMQA